MRPENYIAVSPFNFLPDTNNEVGWRKMHWLTFGLDSVNIFSLKYVDNKNKITSQMLIMRVSFYRMGWGNSTVR